MRQVPHTIRHWQRVEYEHLVDLGIFEGEPLELIGGQLMVAEPQGAYHASTINKVEYALRAILPPGWIVRGQAPVALDDDSRSPSRCPSPASRSTGSGRAASTRAPEFRTTGS
jgi:hypothetical protein